MPRPLFSLVVTVPAPEHLAEFIASVEGQTFTGVEVIAVDHSDGSETGPLLSQWAARASGVRVLTAPGAGVATARNLGLAQASGTWVGFPRAQDRLPKAYLARLAAALDAGTPDLVAARKKRWSTDDDRSRPNPLALLFATTRTVDLVEQPTSFHTDLDTAFLPLDALRATGLQFDDRVSPNFNGGHLCARFLLTRDRPRIRFVKEAVYWFRVRPGSLPMDPTLRDPNRFDQVPRVGFLDLLTDAAGLPSGIPGWLKSAILYEVSLYLRRDQQVTRAPSVQAGPAADRFRAVLAEIAALIGAEAATGLGFLTPEWRQVLFEGLPGRRFATPYAVFDRYDEASDTVRVWIRSTAPGAAVEYHSGGRRVMPVAGKIRGVQYFGAAVLNKQIAWVPLGDALAVTVDGRPVPLLPVEPLDEPLPTPAPVAAAEVTQALTGAAGQRTLTRAEQWAVRRARLPWIRRRYRDAWIVMDRQRDADDNGERLFEYLREARPEINAWFVIEADSPDYARLVSAHGDRVVAYGSAAWFDLALNCRTVASSHLTPAILNPPLLRGLPRAGWKTAFLQHGVVRDDVSRWFNRQPVDFIVASTRDELDSFVADGTNYELTSKEAKLTGLPRFDRLQRLGAEYPAQAQDLVLVAPTWRDDLTARGKDSDQAPAAGFLESEFARNWLALLHDEKLRRAVAAAGKRLGFLPHPNLQSILSELDLPDDIEVLGYAGQDVQRFIARSAIQITDYSSMAFNTAWLGRPVVYFQFDAEAYLSGANNSRPGYFDFRRDGFGPVTTTVAETVAATRDLLAGTPQLYRDRIRDTFPERDGRCCERTTEAILALHARGTTA